MHLRLKTRVFNYFAERNENIYNIIENVYVV